MLARVIVRRLLHNPPFLVLGAFDAMVTDNSSAILSVAKIVVVSNFSSPVGHQSLLPCQQVQERRVVDVPKSIRVSSRALTNYPYLVS